MQSDTMVIQQTCKINLSHQDCIMVTMIELKAKSFHSWELYYTAPYIPIAEARGITAFVDNKEAYVKFILHGERHQV